MATICVCACTYRRPDGLRALLNGFGNQTFAGMPRPSLHVVIADNEGSEQARHICTAFERHSGIPLTYVHEPQRRHFVRPQCLPRSHPDVLRFFRVHRRR